MTRGIDEAPVVTTDALLLAGVATAVVFVVVLLVEGARRRGYDPVYHTVSELELGGGGWIQRGSFLLMAAGVFAFALGVRRALETVTGVALLAVFGLGLLVAGVFAPDAVRGYPPGAPRDPAAAPSGRAWIHHVVSGPVAFLALFGACLALAGRLEGGWRVYTLVTAGVGLVLTASTAVAFRRDAPRTGLVQRGLLLTYWSWIAVLGIHLAGGPPTA